MSYRSFETANALSDKENRAEDSNNIFNPPSKDQVADSLLDELNKRQQYPGNQECDRRPQAPNLYPLQNTCKIDLQTKFPEVRDSTMKIVNYEGEAVGSGYAACDEEGKVCGIITNFHVVKIGPADKDFYFLQGEKVSKGHVVKKDRENDLSFLVLDPEPVKGAQPITFKPVTFGKVEKEDAVFTSCYPTLKLNEPFVNSGKVIATNARVLVATGTPILSPPSIVTDQVNIGGCSGGANFNAKGELIGTLRADGAEGTVAIRNEHAIKLIEDYKIELETNKH